MAVSLASAPATNLPVGLTRFVGRRHELTEAKRLLATTRLLTLTGAGGVGKTRLALHLATEVQRAFPDGVWLVELAELTEPALLGHTVADALGLREQSGHWRLATLTDHLTGRHLLLVLDNCEQLVDACAVLVDQLLRTCPQLHVLATSRQPLSITGESILPVPPLPVPDPDRLPPPEALARYDAVTLLLDRAASAVPGFRLTADNHAAVARLCQALEGIPLALELAAVRLRALSASQILERLTDRYALLSTGSRSAPSRQQTLRACIDWSFQLCSAAERTLWARLAVFSGGFELDAAEGICADDQLSRQTILDLIAALVDKSILIREEHGVHIRYRLLETIRQYGQERLHEGGELTVWRCRHRDWYAELVAQVASDWISPRQAEWLARLRRDHANLRAVLDLCISDPEETVTGLRIATTLEYYWVLREHMSEGRHWLDLALAFETGPEKVRARALQVDAWLATLQRDTEVAVVMLDEAEALVRRAGDAVGLASVTLTRGLAAMFQGELAQAIGLLEQVVPVFRAAGELTEEVCAFFLLGLAAGLAGDAGQADLWLGQCLAMTEARQECGFRSYALWALGLVAWRQGDSRRAVVLETESLRIKIGLDDRLGIAFCFEALAWIAATERQAERAAVLLGAAEPIWRGIGMAFATIPAFSAYRAEGETAARRIGERAFQTAFRRGAGLSLEEAVAFAVDDKTQGPPSPSSGTDAAKLTRRELEIAELLAQGLSNREIANKLVIATRTAEGHVEHILSKLGFTSRAQIAAWVAERRAERLMD